MVSEAEKFKDEDEKNRQLIESKNSLESYMFNIENALNEEKLKDKFTEEDRTLITDKINEIKQWLESNPTDKSEFDNKQKELETVYNPIMKKVYGSEGPQGMPGMPGMPNMGGMSPDQMKQMEEMFKNMSPQEKEEMMKQAQGMMGGNGGPKVDEVD